MEKNAEEIEKKNIINEYRSLIRAITNKVTPEEKKIIRKAFDIAINAHENARRKSGKLYISHPISVAKIIANDIGLGAKSIICSLLHDVVEDTSVTLKDIEADFGKEVSLIIDGLTKISGVVDADVSLQAENFRKMILTISNDIRVVLIKIADRLDNMRTLEYLSEQKQERIASETLYLYAPLAHRLGLYSIKTELEDLSLKYTDQNTYFSISKKLNETKDNREKYIKKFTRPIKERLKVENIKCSIKGRPKSIFSIRKKMIEKEIEFEEVFDKFAIRIIIDCPKKKEKEICWKVYSIVTDFYKPNPDRLRDWISNVKLNGYESLHTTVMGMDGSWVEVQIRTERMDENGYHTMIGPNKNLILSMALSGTWNMLQFTHEPNMTYSEIMDGSIDNINQGNENSSTPDLNFGILVMNDYFDIGLSVRNLFAPEANATANNNSLERLKYIVLHGSYLGRNNPRNPIGLIPSFVIRKMGLISHNSLFQLDLNLKVVYVNKIWAGMTYRTHEQAICTLLGVNTEYGFFGWSYDIGASELGSYHNGSHNIAIGLTLKGKNKRKIRNQNPFDLNIDNEWRRINIPFVKKHHSGNA